MKLQVLSLFLLLALHAGAQDFNQSPYQDFFMASPVVADFNGDTLPDVLGIQFFTTPNRIVLQLNHNTGSIGFSEQDLGLNLDAYGQPDAADMDGDGDMDVLVSVGVNYDIFILKNDGNAYFTPDSLGVSGAFVLKAGDLDNDGDMDIIGINTDNNDLVICPNDGAQHFTKWVVPGFDNLEYLSLNDMDNDSDLDIVCGYDQFSGKQITIYLNLGGGSFVPINVAANELNGLDGMLVSDMNSDGNLDIVFISGFSCKAYVSQGGLMFTQKSLVGTGNPIRSLAAADFNGDGRTDLAIGTNSADIYWYKNLSNNPLQFSAATSVGEVSPAFTLTNSDLDKDGDQDLVVTNGEFWWYENVMLPASGTLNFPDRTISVYPNPVRDVLRFDNIGQDPFSVNITDTQGRTVFSVPSVSGRIDLSALNNGLYYLSLTNLATQHTLSTSIIKVK